MNIVDNIAGVEEFKVLYKEAAEDAEKATLFWNRYNANPHELLRTQQYQMLRERMFQILRTCQQIDQEAYEKIHKGHPYFFIGITSYRLGDYQTAISFFDAALSEDLSIDDEKERPTQLFFRLKGDDPRNAAMLETRYVETKVKRSCNYYNDQFTKNLDIQKINILDLREYFVDYVLSNKDDPGLRTLLTTFITFIVEWDFRNEHFDLGVKNGTSEPLFLHLFRGCVLFESLLKRTPYPKEKHEHQNTLGKLIVYYKNEMKLPKEFIISKPKINTLGKLLSEMNNREQVIEDSILISYWLRNILGHSFAWDERIGKESYRNLYFRVIASSLHVINCLWRNTQ